MDPFFARNRLSAYLDGALTDAESTEVADAIERDPDLRTEFELLRRTVQALRSHGPAEAPAGFHARLMERIQDEPGPRGAVVWLRRSFARLPVEAIALAAAAAVVVIVIQGRPGEEPEEEVTPVAAAPAPVAQAPAQAPDVPQKEAPVAQAAEKVEPVAEAPGAAPPERVAASSKMRKDAYVPEWDAEPAGAQADATAAAPPSRDMAKPFGYRVTLSEAKVLYDLSAIAEQAGGRMLDSAGRTVRPRALDTEDNYAQVQLVVPEDRADHVHTRLRKLGATAEPPPSSTPLFGKGQVGFVVEVQYLP